MQSVTQTSSTVGTKRYQKYGKRLDGVMWLCIVVAVVLTFALNRSDPARALFYSTVVGAILVFFEIFWCLGMMLMGIGFGLRLRDSGKLVRNPKKLWHEARTEKPNFIVWTGHYINTTAAIMQGATLVVAGFFFLPQYMGTVVVAGFVDLTLTLLRCIPTQILLKGASAVEELHVTTATYEDVDAYVVAQQRSWDDETAAPRDVLLCRLNMCGDCIYVARRPNGEPVGFVTTIRLREYNFAHPPSWGDVTDNGWCRTHQTDGKIMYGVDMSKMPNVSEEVNKILLFHCMKMAIKENVKVALLGGRMPGYHRYSHLMTAEMYVNERKPSGRPLDVQVGMYLEVPGVQVVGVIPDYFPDPDSLNYGVLLRWDNPPFRNPVVRTWWRLMMLTKPSRNALAWAVPQLLAAEEGYDEWRALRRRRRQSSR